MEYKAQLVIRSREREGVELIEKIKKLAGEKGNTFSDTALELLFLGLDAFENKPNAEAPQKPKAAKKPKKTASESKSGATSDTKAKANSKAAKSSAPKKAAPKEPAAEVPDADLPSAAEVGEECIAQIKAEAPTAATQVLASFFGRVGPIQGGRVKNILQAGLSEKDFNQLMLDLRKTREYRSYRQRVIFDR